jgi:hypothetical protein
MRRPTCAWDKKKKKKTNKKGSPKDTREDTDEHKYTIRLLHIAERRGKKDKRERKGYVKGEKKNKPKLRTKGGRRKKSMRIK